jgi:cadmium resistance protein CadD (predicted permease)
MNSDGLHLIVGKAFGRLTILGLVWSVFFALYKVSGYSNPGLVGLIFFLLGIYVFLEVFSIILQEVIRRKQNTQNNTVHDMTKHKLHKDKI